MPTNNRNYTATQKAVSGGEPTHLSTVNLEGGEEATEVFLITEDKKKVDKHVKMVSRTKAGNSNNKAATVTLEGG